MLGNSKRTFTHLLTAMGLAVVSLPQQTRADDAPASASATSSDKQNYTLFNVTPASQLRPLSADANDGVMDPTTLDAGHVEIQGSLVDYYTYSKDYNSYEHFSEDHFVWGPRISIGLTHNVDLFLHPSFQVTSYSYSGQYNASHDSSGYEGINIGAKVNLWGNDGGQTAFSVAPYLSFPNHENSVLGGADISFAVRLPNQFYLKFMTDPSAINGKHDSVSFGMENSVSLHRTFYDNLDTYAYLNTTIEPGTVPWYGYAGFGLGYQFTSNFELFGGIGFGLTSNSYDYNPRLGLVLRF